MPSRPNRPRLARGIYAEHSVGSTIELTIVDSDGDVIFAGFVHEHCYDRRFQDGLQKWLDRMDPTWQPVVIEGGASS